MSSKTKLHFPLYLQGTKGQGTSVLLAWCWCPSRAEQTMVWRPRSPLPHGLERLQRILELFHLQVLTPAVNLAKTALRGRARKATGTARCLSGRISALWLACIVHSDPLRKKSSVFSALVSQIGVVVAGRQWLCAINTRERGDGKGGSCYVQPHTCDMHK